MYPITCAGGFNVPARGGKFEIVGFNAVPNDTTAAMEIAIIDDVTLLSGATVGKIYANLDAPTERKNIIVHKYVAAATEIEWVAPEPVKIRHGISLFFDNVKQGSFCVYMR